jgi:tRNA dimethylallyltransferase
MGTPSNGSQRQVARPAPERHVAKRHVIVAAGPTASGKSALALAVAREFGGAVVNADAMQIYDGLPILTNRPTAADQALAPHRLYGILPPSEACSAGRWLTMAVAECEAAWAQGRIPVVAGGTGLYLHALIHGLSPIPDIPAEIRLATRERFRRLGNTAFHAELAGRDPDSAARVGPQNSQRLMRAWEVIEATGRSLVEWQTEPRTGALAARALTLLLMPPAETLYPACDRRFETMMNAGALEEVRALKALGLAPDLPAMKIVGVPELLAYLGGSLALDQAIERSQQATRRYAKRQFTWFRHRIDPDCRFEEQFSESLAKECFSIIRHFLLTPP